MTFRHLSNYKLKELRFDEPETDRFRDDDTSTFEPDGIDAIVADEFFRHEMLERRAYLIAKRARRLADKRKVRACEN